MPFILVLSTAPSLNEARRLSRILLDHRLAACINISAPIESHYWWEGKKVKGREYLLSIKTSKSHFSALEKILRRYHSYTTPEVIALDIRSGSQPYLKWIAAETHGGIREGKKKLKV